MTENIFTLCELMIAGLQILLGIRLSQNDVTAVDR